MQSSVTEKGLVVGAAVTLVNITKIVKDAAGEGKSKVYEALGDYLSHVANKYVLYGLSIVFSGKHASLNCCKE